MRVYRVSLSRKAPRMAVTLGLDFGTNRVRALLVRVDDGEELAAAVVPYPHGQAGVLLDPRDPNLARQYPGGAILPGYYGIEAGQWYYSAPLGPPPYSLSEREPTSSVEAAGRTGSIG
jgi:hypothetical protein